MPEPILTISALTAVLTLLAGEVAKGAAEKAGESIWKRLTGATAEVWGKIKGFCRSDPEAAKAVAAFEAHPQDSAHSETLAGHIQRLSERNPVQARELADLCERFRQEFSAAGDVTVFNQNAPGGKIINIQQEDQKDGSITIN